jgi:uncharacterized protein YecE (DUF72 family)
MLRIGTSGWTYEHWKNIFYPPRYPQAKWLDYYTRHFDTVEINATFYRIPTSAITQNWLEKTPPSFGFAVKISRLITHVHKLNNCKPILEWFFTELAPLKSKTLAYLFQFPPAFCPSKESLLAFLELLPPDNRYVFEFRNKDCYKGNIPEILTEKGISFCIHDYYLLETPHLITAKLVYIRLHGYLAGHAGFYPDFILGEWADRIRHWQAKGLDILIYFNNDIRGFAVQNAKTLQKLLV